MIRRIKTWAVGLMASALLMACGGGGGDPGRCELCGGETGEFAIRVDVQRSGASVNSISSTETVQAVARVVDNTGHGVEGVLVTFAEANVSLLKFAPSTGTALTDASGFASVDISAQTTASAGATTVNAAASVDGTAVTSEKSISVSANGQVETPDPSAINFVSVVPADQAIVIKGAGGNGRSESATLTFKVVDANNAPIKGVAVSFAVNPKDKVTLNIPTGTSDLDGLVTTTVHSGTEPTSVVITATATALDGAVVSGQSDTLVVSNGVAVEGSFEIVAERYNVDGGLTGDTTKVSAFVADANGNPVPDGLAVSFTTDFGAIASSDLGGCLTVNGTCDVDFRVQDPRGNGLATIIATVNVGADTQLADSIPINMAGATGGPFQASATPTGPVLTALTLNTCKQTYELFLRDIATGHSVTAGTTISVSSQSSDVSAAITSGTPVFDAAAPAFLPNEFTMEVDVTSTELDPPCVSGGTVTPGGFVILQYQTPGARIYRQRFGLSYPQ